MTKLYLLSKTIHRFLVIITSITTLMMAITGILLKYPLWINSLNIDIGLIRFIHNNLSILFTLILVLMTISGIVMYIYPIMKMKK